MQERRQNIEIEGLFAEGVLGVFRVIRGFADLRELAAISVSYTMGDAGNGLGRVAGHQRAVSERHAEDLKRYLELRENRFFPEVILSVRVPVNLVTARGEVRADGDLGLGESVYGVTSGDDTLVRITRRYKRASSRVQRLRIRYRDLEALRQATVIRRIDGNHRLHRAGELADDENLPSKYLAPFCMVLLGPPGDRADDYAESLMFHTINSKALRLESEHGLRLLLGQDPEYAMTPENEFTYSPELHLTRLLVEGLKGLPAPARARFGERPLTALLESGRSLIEMDEGVARDQKGLAEFAQGLFAALSDIVTRLADGQPSLCGTYGFLELAARAWHKADGESHEERVDWTVDYLDGLGRWLGRRGITQLLDPQSPAEMLLAAYDAARSNVPKRVFLARWYPSESEPGGAHKKAGLRLEQVRRTLDDIHRKHGIELELIDLGTVRGPTYAIHPRMYQAIETSDIVVCDLTGQRPNVYVEAGFALGHHEKGRLVFLFQPACKGDEVPFDLTTFKHVRIGEAAELPEKLGGEIEEILRVSGAVLGG